MLFLRFSRKRTECKVTSSGAGPYFGFTVHHDESNLPKRYGLWTVFRRG